MKKVLGSILMLRLITADVFAQDEPRTALDSVMEAIAAGDIEALKTALASKPDVNSSDNHIYSGETPLVTAAGRGFIKGIEWLIRSGAKPDQPNAYGKTPLLACVLTMRSVGEGKGGDDEDDRSSAETTVKQVRMAAKLLIKSGANINLADPETGETPLHKAALSGDVEMVEILLASKANENAKDKEGHTALESLDAIIVTLPEYDDSYTAAIFKLLRKPRK